MDAIIIKSRYKVTQVIHVEEGFAALLAVDIVSRDKSEYILNVYEGELGKRYASLYDRLRHCPEYAGMFLSNSALVAVFTYRRAQEIDDVFYKGAAADWKLRINYAQLLFHRALSVSDFPSEISCAAFLASNLKIQLTDMKLYVNYIASPLEGASTRELICLLADNIHKVLIRRFFMSLTELDFVESLDSGKYRSVAAAYTAWQDVMGKIMEEYEKVFSKGVVFRFMHFLRARLGGRFRKRKKKA